MSAFNAFNFIIADSSSGSRDKLIDTVKKCSLFILSIWVYRLWVLFLVFDHAVFEPMTIS